ncbi:MAG: SUMF1/EgtB/PvdO family nonheme iron enzyme [Deltaproteobacteria bacterium]|nr:SUMF1/EgtB/PvdO family nonheme iron enzyme [Deltaproteobacteria bacterium]
MNFDKKPQIFLAHASEDKDTVRKLYAQLSDHGFFPWIDELDIIPGQNWRIEIPNAINSCKIVLACLSKNSIKKQGYIQEEFRLALHAYAQKPPGSISLIPVRLDNSEMPDIQLPQLGVSFRDIQWLDLWKEQGFELLTKAILNGLCKKNSKNNIQKNQKKGGNVTNNCAKLIDPSTNIEFVWVPEGSLFMGQSDHEKKMICKEIDNHEYGKLFSDELPCHEVFIDGFWIGKYEITVDQFRDFIELSGYKTSAEIAGFSHVKIDECWKEKENQNWINSGLSQQKDHPVVNVSWNDAKAMAKWLSDNTGHTFRLPTEAEWEKACRAGTTSLYNFGDQINADQANYNGMYNLILGHSGIYRETTTPVGLFNPNSYGVYDMHGNVFEWCEDIFSCHAYINHQTQNPKYYDSGLGHVIRGGSWNTSPYLLRSSARNFNTTDHCRYDLGFRIVRML